MYYTEDIMIKVDSNNQIKSKNRVTDHGEVVTHEREVNGMLDLLPASLWTDKNAKFLDPVSKTGYTSIKLSKLEAMI